MSTVTVVEVKQQLGVTLDEDDAMIQRKIDAAERFVERIIGRTLASFDDDEDFPDGVPDDLLEAIRMQAAHLYENRESTMVGVTVQTTPFGVEDLIRPYRTWVFA